MHVLLSYNCVLTVVKYTDMLLLALTLTHPTPNVSQMYVGSTPQRRLVSRVRTQEWDTNGMSWPGERFNLLNKACIQSSHFIFTSPQVRVLSIAISLSLRRCLYLSVCPIANLINYMSKCDGIFCTCYLWPWLTSHLMTEQYVMWVPCCGRRHVLASQVISTDLLLDQWSSASHHLQNT